MSGSNPEKPLTFDTVTLPDRIMPGGQDGISLVTCAMNRTENLLKALHTWLEFSEISEIIIIDWSSDQPVRTALDAAGIDDSRIRLVRVTGEPRWILSYAFNIGFRIARYARILKVDADITLGPAFFRKNKLLPGAYIAGNWRKVKEGQAHVNGFFFLHRDDLARVGGFNEFITTYGWDDDEIYNRLVNEGVERHDVQPGTVFHQPHMDDDRIGGRAKPVDSAIDEITRSPLYHIRRNRFLANVMPVWKESRTLLPLEGGHDSASDLLLQHSGWLPNEVPDHINSDADYYALMELTSWRLGVGVLKLDRDQLKMLVNRSFSDLSPLDVELLLSDSNAFRASRRGTLVVDLLPGQKSGGIALDRALDRLKTYADAQGFGLALLDDRPEQNATTSEQTRSIPCIPMGASIGDVTTIDLEDLKKGLRLKAGRNYRITLTENALVGISDRPASPLVAPIRDRLFIDAQHGLGNRLRAIGSAAAIADRTGRELVVVWKPDHHCECRMSDLFDYGGAVIGDTFLNDAAARRCTVFNYMEVEEAAQKDALIAPDLQGDLYVRSAYTLNSPHTGWNAENRFLRGLMPVEVVRNLVDSVRTPNDVSAHIRMVGGADYEQLPYESAGNWTEEGHATTGFWRRSSHFSHFMNRIDTLISDGRAERIFLAADKPETYEAFRSVYGTRVACLPRELYDRSAEQLQYALADALLLSSAPLLLGSTWSSFSELARRLSPRGITTELSGRDFSGAK